MKKSQNYGILAILTLAFAALLSIADTACYGDLEYHVYKTPYDSCGEGGDGYESDSRWDGDSSHADAEAWDGPTWSSAWTGTGSDNALICKWTTGGTGTELLSYSYSIYVDGEISGNAINSDPQTTGYGWASASADAAVGLWSYYSEDDISSSVSISLYDSATEPGYIDDDDDDSDSNSGYCYADATIIVDHDCSAAAYIDTDASWMDGEADAEVNCSL